MLDWKRRQYPAGTHVRIIDLQDKHYAGILLTAYDADSEDNEMPQLRTDGGTELMGYECWWIPENECREAADEQAR